MLIWGDLHADVSSDLGRRFVIFSVQVMELQSVNVLHYLH